MSDKNLNDELKQIVQKASTGTPLSREDLVILLISELEREE